MKSLFRVSLIVLFSCILMSCAKKRKKVKYHHSTENYKVNERHPSAGEHAPIIRSVLDINLYDACRRERSEFYCKRRLGTWRQ